MTTPDTPNDPPVPAASHPTPLASWGTRAVGFLIDILPMILLNLLTFWSSALSNLAWVVSIGYTIYLGYMEGLTGQTPGKAIMGTRLVDQQGALLGSGAAIGRKFVHILDSLVCLLGWFLPIVDDKRQTIADKVMTSYVVEGAEKKAFGVDLWMPPSNTPAT